VKEYSANVIAENMLNQIENEPFSVTHLVAIIDYSKTDDALVSGTAYAKSKRRGKRLRKTTSGWSLLVCWSDGTDKWLPLKNLKESHPVETAEFAVASGIDKEPAFVWWVPYTLQKHDVIVASVRACSQVTTKYGIEVPCTIHQAYELDKTNGNDLWDQSIKKEMRNIGIAFEILDPTQSVPPGWTKTSGHLVFDVKMDFTRKSWWVLDGHLTDAPTDISTYAGVVSRESKRIALTYASLNNIDVYAADIQNASLQALLHRSTISNVVLSLAWRMLENMH
ncbi:MAG TPA: hypothetical protein V6D48_22595, partial [Oculatellaceae cyanobacterium]